MEKVIERMVYHIKNDLDLNIYVNKDKIQYIKSVYGNWSNFIHEIEVKSGVPFDYMDDSTIFVSENGFLDFHFVNDSRIRFIPIGSLHETHDAS